MSSITRKNKRRVAFKCAKQGIAPAQAIAVSAAREIKATKEATAETMEVLLQAIALVAAHDLAMVLTEGQKQAIEKLDKEMEAAKDPCSKYIAEQLLQLATSCPEVSEKILEQKKTLFEQEA